MAEALRYSYQGTVNRMDEQFAYVTFTDYMGRPHHCSIDSSFFRAKGIKEGDDFVARIEGVGDKERLTFELLPRRELTPAEVDAIRQQAEELRDE